MYSVTKLGTLYKAAIAAGVLDKAVTAACVLEGGNITKAALLFLREALTGRTLGQPFRRYIR